jgi:DNA polymerase epsilon subunit 4
VALTIAQEEFIQTLAQSAHNEAKLERKPRRNIQYKDVASAVSRHERLQFLEDMVPKTVPFKKAKALAAGAPQPRARADKPAAAAKSNGPAILEPMTAAPLRPSNGAASTAAVDDDPNEQLELEMRQAAAPARDADVHMSG